MDNIQKLRELKELLDEGILTQDEFNQKKREVLEGSSDEQSKLKENESFTERKTLDDEKISALKSKLSSKRIKEIGVLVCIIAVLAIVGFCGNSILNNYKQSKRAAALEAGIESIMTEYGISTYTVKYKNSDYDVYAEGFESLTNGDALELLKALDGVSVDDPFGNGDLEFYMTNVHPGINVEYSYWRVSSSTVSVNKMYGGGYSTPGIYCNRSGSNECVYKCKN
jgi:hypothetical protein